MNSIAALLSYSWTSQNDTKNCCYCTRHLGKVLGYVMALLSTEICIFMRFVIQFRHDILHTGTLYSGYIANVVF